MHNQIEHILVDEEQHSGIIDVQTFRVAVLLNVVWWLQTLGKESQSMSSTKGSYGEVKEQ